MLNKKTGRRPKTGTALLTATAMAVLFSCTAYCSGTLDADTWDVVFESETETEVPVMDAIPKAGTAYGLVPTAVKEVQKKREETETETIPVADPFSRDYPGRETDPMEKPDETRGLWSGTYAEEDSSYDVSGSVPKTPVAETEQDLAGDMTESEEMEWRKETFPDLGLSIEVPDMCAVEDAEDSGYRYIYLGKSNEIIPYIILGTWENVDMNQFRDVFFEYMKGHFPDIVVSLEETPVIIDNRQMYKTVYEYTVTGARCRDTRIAWPVGNGRVFLFGSKEIPEMRYTLGDLLMKIVKSSEYEADPAQWEKGSIKDGTYTNESFRIETTLPDGWRFETPSEITKTSSLIKNMTDEEGLPEASVPDASQYDASAVNADGTQRWNVVLQDFTGYALNDTVSEADTRMLTDEITEREKGTVENGLKLYSFESAEAGTASVCDGNVPCVLMHAVCGDTQVWQRTAVLLFGETTVAYITVTTEGEDETMDIMEMFHEPEDDETETETEQGTENTARHISAG